MERFSGPVKNEVLQLRIKKFLREGDGICLPADQAQNREIIAKVAEFNNRKEIMLRRTIFVDSVFHSPPGSLPPKSIMTCSSTAVRCWMKAASGIYPTADYLHRINKANSRKCVHCHAESDSLVHFMCFCPHFHDARTKAHNRAWTLITSELKQKLPTEWTLYVETPMFLTGLKLEKVLVARASEGEPILCDLKNWRPDGLAISRSRKKIGILDLCRCSDRSKINLRKAYEFKMTKYDPIQRALKNYSDLGWKIEILPWIVGTSWPSGRTLVRCTSRSRVRFPLSDLRIDSDPRRTLRAI